MPLVLVGPTWDVCGPRACSSLTEFLLSSLIVPALGRYLSTVHSVKGSLVSTLCSSEHVPHSNNSMIMYIATFLSSFNIICYLRQQQSHISHRGVDCTNTARCITTPSTYQHGSWHYTSSAKTVHRYFLSSHTCFTPVQHSP